VSKQRGRYGRYVRVREHRDEEGFTAPERRQFVKQEKDSNDFRNDVRANLADERREGIARADDWLEHGHFNNADQRYPKTAPFTPNRFVLGQGGNTQTAEIRSRVVNNQLKLEMEIGGKKRFIYGIGVRGSMGVFPAHYFLSRDDDGHVGVIMEDCPMTVTMKHVTRNLRYDHTKLVHVMEKDKHFDLVAYDFGRDVPLFTDILKHFRTFEEARSFYACDAEFLYFDGKVQPEKPVMMLRREYYACDEQRTQECYVSDYWSYSPKLAGDCGNILFSVDQGCILGLHTSSVFWHGSEYGSIGVSARIDVICLRHF
jgi:hypothetical protein